MAVKIFVLITMLALSYLATSTAGYEQHEQAFNAHELLKALSQKAEEQGLKSRFEAKFQSLKDSIAVTMANSCSELCQSASYGDGTIIGTSPFCGGDCSEDCTVGHCYIGSLAWADYGNGCWSGNKVCCCAM